MNGKKSLKQALAERRMLMDGAMGTMIQTYGLTEGDFRGSLLADSSVQLKGNNDVLVLTRPDVIGQIHTRYLEAGADIIITDTFSSQRISQQEYMLCDRIADINRAAVRLAMDAVEGYEEAHPETRGTHYVLGGLGPTSRMLSMSDDVTDPSTRSMTYDEMRDAFAEQIGVLVAEGVDGILLETSFDTLNVKAAIAAYQTVCREQGRDGEDIQLLISMTISDASGRILSGQTVEAFVESVIHARPLVIGMNCGMGAEAMVPYLRRMKEAVAGRCHISCHPNAGLPNQFGQYDDTPEDMARQMQPMISEGLADIIGGCCGTTPEHISRMRMMIDADRSDRTDRKAMAGGWHSADTDNGTLTLTGLEAYRYGKEDFVMVGERCNVAGSRKFLRLINEKCYDDALDIARTQVNGGAMVIDVNMDDGLLDAKAEMTTFLNLLMSDPSVCRVPVMIDSSRFDVIEAGLKCCQGKCIVNSISLKQGEEIFIRQARTIQQYGAAVIVMLFDEEGQATDYERRITIAARAYRLLTEVVGMSPCDIIFDPNILTIATGMDEHRRYALDFIRATRWITDNLPGARISGGLSNLSFAFRGNNRLRECMHSVFLHLAREAGMNMAIMNPMTMVQYGDVPDDLRDTIRAVIMDEDGHATERLTEMAAEMARQKAEADKAKAMAKEIATTKDKATEMATAAATGTEKATEGDGPEARLKKALIEGTSHSLEQDLKQLTDAGATPLDIISGPLMEGMNTVGRLFGEGRMFLPQVVKTARTMKRAVDILIPPTSATAMRGSGKARGTVLMATVKGDVHDIGKNIVGVVMACNGFDIIDLGVMVTADTIVEKAISEKADIVCLSGLITPSLDEMCHVVSEMQRAGLTIPVMVGGATTSEIHTAVKIAPLYGGSVFHVRDASQNPGLAMRLMDPEQREQTVVANRSRQQRIRMAQQRKEQRQRVQRMTMEAIGELSPMERRFGCDWEQYTPPLPPFSGRGEVEHISVRQLMPCIDWLYFYWAWRVKEDSDEGRMLRQDAEERLQKMADDPRYDMLAIQTFRPAGSNSEGIMILSDIQTPCDCMTTAEADVSGKSNAEADACEAGEASAKTAGAEAEACEAEETAASGGGQEIFLPTPRQSAITADGRRREQCLALCDYVRSHDDYVGAFAATVPPAFIDQLEALKQSRDDDYEALLLQTIGDRLAEAASEYMGRRLAQGYTSRIDGRHHSWHGIRPAVGYPSLPDQRSIFVLDRMLNYKDIGISLTENGAMYPQASVTGIYIAHPDATYFSL